MNLGVPSPQERLETIAFFKEKGLACGMFLMPVIPFITDTKEVLEKTIQDAKDVGVDFIIFGGMTLKEGKQKEYFFNILQRYYPKPHARISNDLQRQSNGAKQSMNIMINYIRHLTCS